MGAPQLPNRNIGTVLMTRFSARLRALLVCGLACALLGGCASTGNPRDPLEPLNRGIYSFNDGLDNVVIKPVAQAYRSVLPQFMRTGVHNFFSNINDVIVALNNLLQAKFLNAVSDIGRIVVNTTVGLLGVLDVATELGLEKHNEDFGQTLGYWGVGDGPYLVLPILGPSTLRDTVGLIVDFKTDPITYVHRMRVRNMLWGARMVNRRSELLDTSTILETAALDPYEFLRDAYLQRRRNLVYDGSPPPDKDEDVDIKIKPRTERPDNGPFPEQTLGVGSILVSGDMPTPAQLEAWEKAQRASKSPQPGSAEQRSDAPTNQPRVVRFWSPASSSR